ncbi:protein kinase-like domain-containing protein [Artemisia annua]|uniref:non-specific serine/threonine protein kinase n=1 Tax=Artemisia annua TaxID=35608 RepID=A0A2U1MQJ1_ARTAN|nr:protein kinase-like domain-containing protein [Artemisia annua]
MSNYLLVNGYRLKNFDALFTPTCDSRDTFFLKGYSTPVSPSEALFLVTVSNGGSPEVSHLGWGHWYTLRELEDATDGFADDNAIGQGGYGIVYRGIVAHGTQVAVKNLLNNSRQSEKEFEVEVEAIGRVRHKNILRLLGYCAEGAHRLYRVQSQSGRGQAIQMCYCYCFKVVISVLTCFSPETDSLFKDCNVVLREIKNKDPYVLPRVLRGVPVSLFCINQRQWSAFKHKRVLFFVGGSGVDALPPLYDCGLQEHAQVEEVSNLKVKKQDTSNEERSLSAQSLAARVRRRKISKKTQELGKLIQDVVEVIEGSLHC